MIYCWFFGPSTVLLLFDFRWTHTNAQHVTNTKPENLKRPEIGDAWFRLKCFILIFGSRFTTVCFGFVITRFDRKRYFSNCKGISIPQHTEHHSFIVDFTLQWLALCLLIRSICLVEVCIWEVRNCIQQTTTKNEEVKNRIENEEQTFDLMIKQWNFETIVSGLNSTTKTEMS